MNTASIFDIYRGTTHDGPGLRTTIFFKGCPLSCDWCHNPEGIAPGQRVWWDSRICIGCMLCHAACKTGANISGEKGIHIDDGLCQRCGACVKACPAKAMTFVSRDWALEKLVDEVIRDKVYYDKTGGGVTASGGECMLQSHFIAEFFRELHSRGINTAVDTCGMAAFARFEEVLPHTDYVLYDLKLMDNCLHQKYTKQDNRLIIENLRRIAASIDGGTIKSGLWIRTPLIPGATASAENIAAIGKFICEELHGIVSRWELCAFNNNCMTKYERLNLPWSYRDTPLIDRETAHAMHSAAVESGVREDLVVVTGLISEQ